MSDRYKILLYYKYVPLENPQAVTDWQRQLCQRLNLKGRILISEEGINGTLAGEEAQVNQYMAETTSRSEFEDMEWKVSFAPEQVFPKLKVKLRPEIVTLGIKKTGVDVSLSNKAHYIEPEELATLYDHNEEFVILDARNLYEARIGKFKNALVPPIDTFRDFPQFVDEHLAQFKDKEVVTYCTGGVRCEKASAYLREQGFKKVRQLHGGVHVYAEKTGGKHFEGELFVFDKRLHLSINQVNPSVISQCVHCGVSVARYIDCEVASCPELFICCEGCQETYQSLCLEHAQSDIRASLLSTGN